MYVAAPFHKKEDKMKAKLTWFGLGFITAYILLVALATYRNYPRNVIRAWPREMQEMMLQSYPWLKSARAGELGPFKVFVPASPSGKPEAIMSPMSPANGYPIIFISHSSIDLFDSKKKLVSLKFTKSTGEFDSYELCTGLLKGTSYTDTNLDGQFDIKINPYERILMVNYESRWLPVISKKPKKYIEVNGDEKEIKLYSTGWEFVGQ